MLEMMISFAIFLIIVAAVTIYLQSAQVAYNQGMAKYRGQIACQSILTRITTEVMQSTLIGVAGDGSSVSLQVPVDHDGDGDVISDAGDVEYGAKGQLDWTMTLAFAAARNLSEATDKVDYNDDGDKTDSLVAGRVMLSFQDTGGATQASSPISPPRVLGTSPLGGDLDGDGTNDPLFQRVDDDGAPDANGDNLKIDIFLFAIDRRRTNFLGRGVTIISPRGQ